MPDESPQAPHHPAATGPHATPGAPAAHGPTGGTTPPHRQPDSTAAGHVSQHTSGQSVPRSEHTTPHPAMQAPPVTPPEGLPIMPEAAAGGALRVVVADDNPVVRAGLTALLQGREDIQVVAEASDGRQAYDEALRHRPDVILLDVRMPGVDGISALPHLVRIAPVLMMTYSRESEIVRESLRLGAGGYLVHGEFTADQLVTAVRDIREGRPPLTHTASAALLESMRGGWSQGERSPLPDGLGTAFQGGPGYQEPPGYQPSAPAHTGMPHAPFPPSTSREFPVPGRVTGSQHYPGIPSLSHTGVSQSSSTTGGPTTSPAARGAAAGLSKREVEIMELIASGMTNQQIAATCFISEKTVKNHINSIFTKLHAGSRSEAIARWLGTAPGGNGGHHG